MPSSSFFVIEELNNRDKHPAFLLEITTQLLQGNYQCWPIWKIIVKTRSTLKTATTEPNIIMQEIIPRIIIECDQGIEQDNSNAMFLRALMYQYGQGSNIDYSNAILLYEQAITVNHVYAMNNRAIMHQNGQGGNVDYPAAITLYEQAIALDNADAMNNRANMHQYGQGGNVDYSAAITLYEQAIALDNADAMNNRANMHRYGQGRDIDYPAAIALYNQAITLNNTSAMNNRASMHRYGQGGDVNYSAAITLYERAMAQNNAEAMTDRGYMHQHGQGGNVDYSAAIALYERAITLKNTYAMYYRAALHPPRQAARLYRQAAELNLTAAARILQSRGLFDLSYYKYHNVMLKKNYSEAIEIMEQKDKIFDEFLEYDWPRFVKNLKQHEEAAIQVISIFTREKTNNQEENTKRLRLLIILMQASSEQTFVSQSLNSILFSSISVWMLSVAQIEALANAFIDACHKLKSEYFASIVTLLSTLIQGISLNDLTSLFAQASFIKETIKLMLKLMYGEKVTLLESAEPSIKQLILLITNHHFNKSSIADLNAVLPGLFQSKTTACSSLGYPGMFAQTSEQEYVTLDEQELYSFR